MQVPGRKLTGVMVALSGFVPNLMMTTHPARAQMTANTSLHMHASVVNPLAISPSVTLSLNFGLFAVKGPGSYIVKATSATIKSGVTLAGNQAGTGMINAPQNATLTMSIPTQKAGTSILLTHSGGGAPSKQITAKSIYVASKSGLTNIKGTMKVGKASIKAIKMTNPAGTGRFFMGAKLVFGNNQQLGTYTGKYTLRITF